MYIDKIAETIRTKGLTQKKVAKDLGISTATFNRWMLYKGEPSLSQGYQICHYLGLSVDELFGAPPEQKESLEERLEKIEKLLNVS